MKKYILALLLSLPLMPAPVPVNAALSDECTAYYKCDENTGATTTDSTPAGYVGTITGSAWVSGIINSALSYTLASLDRVLTTQKIMSATTFSLSLWVKSAPPAGVSYYAVSKANLTAGGNGWIWGLTRIGGTYYLNFLSWKTSFGSSNNVNTIVTWDPDIWHHIVITWNNGTLVQYMDGVWKSTTTSMNTINATSIAIGISKTWEEDTSGGWNGTIDEVGLWNRVLQPEEIAPLYNSGAGLQYPFGSTPPPATGAPKKIYRHLGVVW